MPGRDVRKDGLSLVVPVYCEVRRWINDYFSRLAFLRAGEGQPITRGDKLGAGNAMAKYVAWLCSLNDGDLARIEREGAAILADLSRLPADYGRVPGREDPITIRRRTASVFAAAPNPGVLPYAPPKGLRAVAAHRRPGEHGAEQDVPPVEGDPIPSGGLP